jgi:hypothetical protein
MSAPKKRNVTHGLRFDKVATRVIEHLQAAVGEIVPDRTTVLIAITAPIRLPAKTTMTLEAKIGTLFDRRSPRRDYLAMINGNRVRIRLLKDQPVRAPKLLGFVHNPDLDPRLLFERMKNVSRLGLPLSRDERSAAYPIRPTV